MSRMPNVRRHRPDGWRGEVQLSLFLVDPEALACDVETRVQAILARRRSMNASGQAGEDVVQIRAAVVMAMEVSS